MSKTALHDRTSKKRALRKLALSCAAVALSVGAGAPAFAKGGHHGGHNGAYGYSKSGHYGRHYKRHHRGHYSRHHRHGGGGKGAAIALGVIGGAIILNELAEERARQRYYEERYDRYYDRDARRSARLYEDDRARYDEHYEDDYRDDQDYWSEEPAVGARGDGLDDQLEGGGDYDYAGRAPNRSLSADAAFRVCTNHARNALGDQGYVLAAPSVPETADDLGGAWKMTANVTAQNQYGDRWTRAMYCEADERRVYLIELI